MIFCTNCGSQVTGRFCPKCGQDCDPQQGEKIDETLKKLYTLRAGISVISEEMDKAENVIYPLEQEISLEKKKKIEKDINSSQMKTHKVTNFIKKEVFTSTEAKEAVTEAEKKIKKNTITFFVIAGVFFVLALLFVFGCSMFGWLFDIGGFFVFLMGVGFGIIGVVFAVIAGSFTEHYIPVHSAEIEAFDELTILKSNLNAFEEKHKEISKQIADKRTGCEAFGNAMYASLKDQFAEFLSPVDWENIDLMIFYFESGRAVNMREALQLVDRQRQTDSIIEAINNATEKICHTINRGIMYINETIVNCASILSSQLSTISAQQTQLLISADSMRRALRNKSNESSRQLMDDVHKICHYTEVAAIEKRNR